MTAWGAESTCSSAHRGSRLTVVVLAGLLALAGCSDDNRTTVEVQTPTEPATFAERGPHFAVLSTPDGFSEAAPHEVPPGWVPLLTHSGGCTLAGRGSTGEEPPADQRAESIAVLEALVAEEEAEVTSEARDVDLLKYREDTRTETVAFASLDAQVPQGTVRFAARVAAGVDDNDGDITETLELRFACPGRIQEAVWQELELPLRAAIQLWGGDTQDPWGGQESG